MFLLVRVLWRSVWVLVAVQVWVSQLLVLGLGVVSLGVSGCGRSPHPAVGLVGGAGGVCSPAVLASLVTSIVGVP